MSMNSTDPIADMLTRIRNGIAANKIEITLPHAKMKEAVARVLQKNGFIYEVRVSDAPVGKALHLVLSTVDGNARITDIERLSTPGRRLYSGAKEIPTVMRGRGVVVVSTSHGVMTGSQAKAAGVGGELICKVY